MKELDKDILKRKLNKRISSDIASGKVGGASVSVMQNGKIIYKNCFGLKDMESGEKLTENNLFRLASMTKPITAVCIMILNEQNKLSLSDPISKYLPGFKNMNVGTLDENNQLHILHESRKPITIENILTHSSGLGSSEIGNIQISAMTNRDKFSLESVVKYYENTLLSFEPGEYDEYSPVAGFDILARIIEIVTGKSFANFAEENIFLPLNMNNTTFTPTAEHWNKLVKMTDFTNGKSFNASIPDCVFSDFPLSYTCGGAGAISCLDDYSNFAEMLLNGGIYNNIRILSEESIKNMYTPRHPYGSRKAYEIWGLGVRVNENGFYKRIPNGTYGWSGAYGTHFWIDNENKLTAVYMKNSLYDGGSGAITAANFEEDVYSSLI